MYPETEPYLLGIDGGGSQLRVIITQLDLTIIGEAIGPSANPNSIGHDVAAQRVQETIAQALEHANIPAQAIAAAGIGIAGASHQHSADWLRKTLLGILPNAKLTLSSDIEIALVGAHGKRQGILLLAGTGSVACGINEEDEYVQAGGWGYMLGDEGSGYWIGLQALKHTIRVAEGRAKSSMLDQTILHHLKMNSAKDLIPWLYHSNQSRIQQIAELAPIALGTFDNPESATQEIIQQAIDALFDLANSVQLRLGPVSFPIAFAGSILTNPNPVSFGVCQRLGMEAIPTARYAPVMGAVLRAKETIT